MSGPWPGLPTVAYRIALAPPGLARLHRVPKDPVDVALPAAATARIPAPDGTRFGFVGTVRVRARVADPALARAVAAAGGFDAAVIDAVVAAGRGARPGRPGREPLAAVRHDLEAAARGELGGRGIDLEGLHLRGIDRWQAAPGERFPVAPSRVLLIGLDGADWAILDPLIAAGRLPNLGRLAREGARGPLLSLSPMISPVVWTTIATGVEPSRHGIVDFLVPGRGGGVGEPVTSAERRVAAVWDVLGDAGVEVGVVGWWASWPAERVRGYSISDRLAYQLFGFRPDLSDARGKTYPPGLYERVRKSIVTPDAVSSASIAAFLPNGTDPDALSGDARDRVVEFRTLLASGRTYVDAALEARRETAASFEAVYLEGTDTVGHLFMPFRSPRLPGVDGGEFALFHDVVDRYYEEADRLVGRLLEGRETGWTVMVVSDHGFATGASRPLTTDSRIGHGPAADWHRRFGVAILWGEGVRRGATIRDADVYDVAPTVLALFGQPVPRSWPGRVLAEALAPAFLDAHPVRLRPDDPPRPPAPEGESVEDPAAQQVREKLRNLGYVGEGDRAPLLSNENNRGVALLSAGRFAEAEAAFRSALRIDPSPAAIRVNLGLALRGEGRLAEAEAVWRDAFETPEGRRPAGVQLAQQLLDAGDSRGAEDVLRKVLRAEPGASDAWNLLGLLLDRRGDERGADEAYREASDADPTAAEPRSNRAGLLLRRSDAAGAEALYRQAIAADPAFVGAYNNLAMLYQRQGRRADAVALYREALERSPASGVVLNNLGSLYYDQGDRTEARRLWEAARGADPRYPSPLNNLAGLALAEGRLGEAEALLDRALALDPAYGDARINLALVRRAQGRSDDAVESLRQASEDRRSAPAAYRELGVVELERGRPAAALEALLRAKASGIEGPDLLNPLGEAYRRLGRRRAAIAAWERSLSLNPAQDDVRRETDYLKSLQ